MDLARLVKYILSYQSKVTGSIPERQALVKLNKHNIIGKTNTQYNSVCDTTLSRVPYVNPMKAFYKVHA